MKYSILLVFIVVATACGHSKGELIDLREKAKFKIKQLEIRKDEAKDQIPIEQVRAMTSDQVVALSIKLEDPFRDSIARLRVYIDSLNLEISKY